MNEASLFSHRYLMQVKKKEVCSVEAPGML